MGIYSKLMELNQSPISERVVPNEPQQAQVDAPAAVKPKKKRVVSRYRDTTTPRYHATTQPRHHDTIVQLVRRAVKQFGKEAATHRFTLEEKKAIADLVYSYRKIGFKTSENEISRIGVNFLINDYKNNGEKSILSQVLIALNR